MDIDSRAEPDYFCMVFHCTTAEFMNETIQR
jgi:hypothetical protein